MIHQSKCPLCSAAAISKYQKCIDHFVSGEAFELWKCNSCGFIFTQDPPDEYSSGSYYESEDYISHTDSKRGIIENAYQAVRKFMLQKKKRLVLKATSLSTGNILDIGSGTGHFLNTMQKAGWRVQGIEINEKTREYSASRFSVSIASPEEIVTLPKAGFDCITLWHVLEHIYDPDNLMSEIAGLLKPSGVCMIALPNSSSVDALHYGNHWAAFDVPRHLWHFSPSTFELFASKNKFTIVRKIVLPFDVFYISIMSEKYRNSALPFLKGALTGGFFYLRSLFNRSASSSLLYILHKI